MANIIMLIKVLQASLTYAEYEAGFINKFYFMNDELTAKSTDPTIVARATTYSGKVDRMVHVFSDEGLAEYAEHC